MALEITDVKKMLLCQAALAMAKEKDDWVLLLNFPAPFFMYNASYGILKFQ